MRRRVFEESEIFCVSSILFSYTSSLLCMKKRSFTLNIYIFFHLPRRIMDPCSIFVEKLPRHLTYGEIKAAFWPFQQDAPLQILKKENYIIITFSKEESVQRILQEKDRIRLKGQRVNIKQASKRLTFVHVPPSFFLPPDVLVPLPPPPPPPPVLLPPFFIPAPPPPAPPAPAPPAQPPAPAPYQHPFPEGFSYFFFINSFMFSLLVFMFVLLRFSSYFT